MKITKKEEVTVDANPMEGVTGEIYRGQNGKWYWHLVLPKGMLDLGGGATFDESNNRHWYDGSADTASGARRGLAEKAGKVYAALLVVRKFLKPERQEVNF